MYGCHFNKDFPSKMSQKTISSLRAPNISIEVTFDIGNLHNCNECSSECCGWFLQWVVAMFVRMCPSMSTEHQQWMWWHTGDVHISVRCFDLIITITASSLSPGCTPLHYQSTNTFINIHGMGGHLLWKMQLYRCTFSLLFCVM